MAKVYHIRDITLKDGVTESDFEAAVARLLPKSTFPGGEIRFLKKDRGNRTWQYVLMIEIDSLEARDRNFPKPDTPSPEFRQWVEANADLVETLFPGKQMVTSIAWGDYVVVGT